jgi:hypothetical protein
MEHFSWAAGSLGLTVVGWVEDTPTCEMAGERGMERNGGTEGVRYGGVGGWLEARIAPARKWIAQRRAFVVVMLYRNRSEIRSSSLVFFYRISAPFSAKF